MESNRLPIFINSVFFVLGFSAVFSLVGVLLQSVLSNVAYTVQNWLGYIGGSLIMVFGFYLLGIIRIGFLEKEHTIKVKKRFRYSYATSFIFGAAFAVGWTPCVGAVLGTILSLAVTNPASAFRFLFSYSLGLGLPFLAVGLFTSRSSKLITKMGNKLKYVNYAFGIILILLGILVFTSQLSRVANLSFLADLLQSLSSDSIKFDRLGIGIAFIAGLTSFLSPCVLPIVPGFLSYLATTAANHGKNQMENYEK